MNAKELAQIMSENADTVARYLIPAGKRDGREWRAGSVNGDAGQSLGICIEGNRAGVWADFATDQRGDLLDLWMAVRNIGLVDAMKEAAEFLGVEQSTPQFYRKEKAWKKPVRPKCRQVKQGQVFEYLTKERGLTVDTIALFKVADGTDSIIFPFLRDGEPVMIKRLKLERAGGKKDIRPTSDNQEPCLFGWQAVDERARVIILTEGEIDAMSIKQMGHDALSIPYGAGKGQTWIENEYDRINRFDEIYVCMDQDEPGQIATAEIVERLGRHRCKILKLGKYKDANEALLAGYDIFDLQADINKAETCDPHELRRLSDFHAEIMDEFYPKNEKQQGAVLPWKKVRDQVRLRLGDISVWAGINSHGKAVDVSTEVPTPDGFKLMNDIHVGDIVFDENGERCNVVAETDVQYNRPCYKIIFSDGTEIIADEEHEWLTHTAKCRQSIRNAKKNNRLSKRNLKKFGTDQTHKRTFPKIVTTKEIYQTVKVNGGCWDGLLEHSIPNAGEIQIREKELPIDPYLLGAWLGDGSSYAPEITCGYADIELIEELEKIINLHEKKTRGENCGTFYFGNGISGKPGTGIFPAFRKLNIVRNKHIPHEYLWSSAEQRLSLLQGIMDTDGHITPKGQCEFCNTNKKLAFDVLQLVRSLGINATIKESIARLYGRDCGKKYRIFFTTNKNVFRLKRKMELLQYGISTKAIHKWIVSCEPCKSVPVKCIQVDSRSNLYLISGSFIATHNSLILSHVAVDLVSQGYRVCIASMEMSPADMGMKMYQQAGGVDRPTKEWAEKVRQFVHNNVWIFNVYGTAKTEKILNVFEYAFFRYGVKHFIVDSLAKCGINEDDYNRQKSFIDALMEFAGKHKVHVHVVIHVRKGEDESRIPGKMDIKGTGSLTDMVDNVFIIWRNKKKEAVMCGDDEDARQVNREKPDAFLKVDKQRKTGKEPTFALWFHPASCQFVEYFGAEITRYIHEV